MYGQYVAVSKISVANLNAILNKLLPDKYFFTSVVMGVLFSDKCALK